MSPKNSRRPCVQANKYKKTSEVAVEVSQKPLNTNNKALLILEQKFGIENLSTSIPVRPEPNG